MFYFLAGGLSMYSEECPFNVVRTNGSDEVLARGGEPTDRASGIRDRKEDVSGGSN